MEQQAASHGGARMSLGGKSMKKPVSPKLVTSIIDGLKQIYFSKVAAAEWLDTYDLLFGLPALELVLLG